MMDAADRGGAMNAVDERRRNRRHAVRTNLHCRRLGRKGFEEVVASVDLSLGGALVEADDRLAVGDVLVLEFPIDDLILGLRGLVVSVRPVATATDRARYVHVAFTGLSPERLEALCQFLQGLEDEAATAG